MNSIPASALAQVIPGVLSAGGNPLSLNAIFLTTDPSIPVGTVQPFANLAAVAAWFSTSSNEYSRAAHYFQGFDNAAKVPGVLYFAQYNTAAVAGYLRGGTLAGVALATIQALSGTITVVIDSVSHVSAAINLSAATSFSNAAALIQTGLQGGTPSTTATVTYDAQRAAFEITSPTTGASSSLAFPTTDSLVTGLLLTAATGAVLSPGAIAAVPATLMTNITNILQNWATFMTVTEVALNVKEAFAAWVQTTTDRFMYVAQDSDVTALTADATGCFGNIAEVNAYDGVVPVYDTSGGDIAAFTCGIAASIDFNQRNGRTTWAYRGQSGLAPQVTNATQALNLIGNSYNFYGAYATANEQFSLYQPGQMPGKWDWIDDYVNQIYFNSQFQLSAIILMQQLKAIPYNIRGYNLLRSAFQDPINQGLNFGAFVPGVALSVLQAQEINQATGDAGAATTIQNIGYYLQISPATAQTRGTRSSPPCAFYYTDGGSIQQINLSSIDVQ